MLLNFRAIASQDRRPLFEKETAYGCVLRSVRGCPQAEH